MIHGTGKIRVRERNSSKGAGAERLTRRRIAVQPEEKARLRINKRVAPPVENDSCDVPLGVETRSREHVRHLLTYLPFVFHERARQQLRSAPRTLLGHRKSRLGKVHKEGEHRGKIRANQGRIHTELSIL